MISKSLFLGLAAIAVAYLYTKYKTETFSRLDEQERRVIEIWNTSIIPPNRQFQKIAVGINCNLDLIVSGVELLEALGQKPGQALDSITVDSLEDLTQTFTHYFSKGSAAERVFTNKDLYADIIRTAEKLQSKQHYIGGNAALMAAKISEMFPDIQVQLVGPIGPVLRALLPFSISVPDNSIIETDETHLIMEYHLDVPWGSLHTPVASRFITSYDESNSRLTMLDQFFSNLDGFRPDLVLLSGLHLLESQSLTYVEDQLNKVEMGLRKISDLVPKHLELASMVNGDCVKMILDKILSTVNSLGLNEQEIAFSSHVAGGPHGNEVLENEGQPEIHKISDIVLWMLQKYGYSKNNPTSKLTRVHFHSLTYHIVGHVPGAWHNSEAAVAAGTRTAGRQACDTNKLSPLDIELRIPQIFKLFSGGEDLHFNESEPVLSWDREGFHFVFSPVLVCKSPLKTVGLGDAISSTGLMYSQFNPSF